MVASGIAVEEVKDDVDEQEDFASDAEVNEVEALPPLYLSEARDYFNRMLEFVTINVTANSLTHCRSIINHRVTMREHVNT
jgi:hypothetical protein